MKTKVRRMLTINDQDTFNTCGCINRITGEIIFCHLHKSAPELLNALRILIMAVGTEHQDRALKEAVEIIAKAEGKAEVK